MVHHFCIRRYDLKSTFSASEGAVGEESHLQPAVLETPSGVSGGVGRRRHVPVCPSRSVVFCRRLSPCVGGHWGTYWGSRCLRGRSSPCPEGGINHMAPIRFMRERRIAFPYGQPMQSDASRRYDHSPLHSQQDSQASSTAN